MKLPFACSKLRTSFAHLLLHTKCAKAPVEGYRNVERHQKSFWNTRQQKPRGAL